MRRPDVLKAPAESPLIFIYVAYPPWTSSPTQPSETHERTPRNSLLLQVIHKGMMNTTDLLFGANAFWVVHWMKQITKAEFVTEGRHYHNNYINHEDWFEAQAACKKSQHWYAWFCVIGLEMSRIQRTKLSLESVKR